MKLCIVNDDLLHEMKAAGIVEFETRDGNHWKLIKGAWYVLKPASSFGGDTKERTRSNLQYMDCVKMHTLDKSVVKYYCSGSATLKETADEYGMAVQNVKNIIANFNKKVKKYKDRQKE